MVERLAKIGLLAAMAFFFSLVVIDNLTDYATNFAYVHHVLSMDTIFPESALRWRAITNPAIQHLFYGLIIAWEAITAILCWIGVIQLGRQRQAEAIDFNRAKTWGQIGLIASGMLWLVGFLCVGGEWFVMWQSPIWNGQPIAFRMFAITSLVWLVVCQPDGELENPQ